MRVWNIVLKNCCLGMIVMGIVTTANFAWAIDNENGLDKNGQFSTEETILAPVMIQDSVVDVLEERRSAPTAQIIVDQKQIEKFDDQTVGDVLRRLPGVTFGGAPGESKDIRIRGLDKEYSQILIDGQRIPGLGEKREFQIDRIPASMIERIEVLKNGSAAFDSQGIAGTINIVLKNTPSKWIGTWGIGGGWLRGKSLKDGDLDLLVGDKIGKFGYLLSANGQFRTVTKDKTKTAFKANGDLDSSEIEDEEKRIKEFNFSPRFTFDLTSQDVLQFQPYLLRSREGKDKTKTKFKADGTVKESETEDEVKDRISTQLKGSWKHKFTETAHVELGTNYQRIDENKDKTKLKFKADGSLDKTEIEDEDKTETDLFSWLHGKFVLGESHHFHFGLEGNIKDREKAKVKTENGKDKTGAKDVFTLDEDRLNFFGEDQFHWGDHTVITPGFRLEHVRQSITDSTNTTRSSTGTDINPSLHLLHHVTKQDNVRFSIARTVRRPKFDDLVPFVDSKDGTLSKPDKVGNPDLQPETAIGLELGVEHFFDNGTGVFSASGFYRNFTGKIENQTLFNASTGRFEETPINLDSAKLWGMDLDGSKKMDMISLPNLTLHGNYSLLFSQVKDPTTGKLRRFKEQPDYVFNVGFDYEVTPLGLIFGSNFNQVGPVDDGLENEIDRINRLDAYVSKKLIKNLTLKLSASNILQASKNKTKTKLKADGSIDKIEKEIERSRWGVFMTLTGTFN